MQFCLFFLTSTGDVKENICGEDTSFVHPQRRKAGAVEEKNDDNVTISEDKITLCLTEAGKVLTAGLQKRKLLHSKCKLYIQKCNSVVVETAESLRIHTSLLQ